MKVCVEFSHFVALCFKAFTVADFPKNLFTAGPFV